ncbi:class I SAM-dependent methyltransferase [Paenibacillus sp. B01]|uniref:class I SAM-dependent methyltransferase n=1 Tax=Paenibacillus sp. B01 TaxID=2660554 RepID=UPI00129B19EE|nr:class I SAM-dependent methyltransferase [Paenibacillus sp. B01]QGG58087.1 methyltransferase domain-containing protein [Paenibacillus sp. B01]
MSRVYDRKIAINENSIQDFYAQRAIKKSSIDVDAPVVLAGDRDKNNIHAWTAFEVEHRLPELQLQPSCKVLEVGCGTGRITKYITSSVDHYVGIDYIEEFIETIKNREDIQKSENTSFYHASLNDLTTRTLALPITRFNRFIISGGVFMYVNDEQVGAAIETISSMLEDDSIIYISEPVALQSRLTLDRFYSEDLHSEYSAIYRTEKEYEALFAPFLKRGFKLTCSEEFFHHDIKKQKETKQWLFVLKKGV